MSGNFVENGKLLTLLAYLIIPGKRGWALAKLKETGLCNIEQIASALSGTAYNYRNTGTRLSDVKMIVDAAVERHDYCILNPRRTMSHLRRHIQAAPEFFSRERFQGSVILDYGCGTFNALSQSIIFMANGARSVYAVDPGTKRWDTTRYSALELVKAIFDSPSDFDFTESSAEEIRSRVAKIDFCKFKQAADERPKGQIDFGSIRMFDLLSDIAEDTRFDLIVSTSVLEHVSDLKEEITRQTTMLKPNGVAVHAVDFTDHRHDDKAYHPFRFYYDGRMKGCNGLRFGEMERLFHDVGLSVTIVKPIKDDISIIDMNMITDRFRLSFLLETQLTD